jgi:hypothetical protein
VQHLSGEPTWVQDDVRFTGVMFNRPDGYWAAVAGRPADPALTMQDAWAVLLGLHADDAFGLEIHDGGAIQILVSRFRCGRPSPSVSGRRTQRCCRLRRVCLSRPIAASAGLRRPRSSRKLVLSRRHPRTQSIPAIATHTSATVESTSHAVRQMAAIDTTYPAGCV